MLPKLRPLPIKDRVSLPSRRSVPRTRGGEPQDGAESAARTYIDSR